MKKIDPTEKQFLEIEDMKKNLIEILDQKNTIAYEKLSKWAQPQNGGDRGKNQLIRRQNNRNTQSE